MFDIADIQTVDHDVIIIGAGGAGLRAAIECSKRGLNTGLVCKSLLGKAHTVMAEGGVAAALGNVDNRDHWKMHFRDTMRGGKFLNVWRMAELHAKQAPNRVRELEEWGAVFDRTKKGLINQRNFGGHRYPRLAHVGDRTGLEIIRTLQDYGVHQGIKVYMECTGLDLMKDGDRISGMVAMWRETGQFIIFKAGAVIMATGGGGKAWKVTSNSWEYTGDGHAMAYEAGAELMDMEFTQFHPTGMVWPPSVHGTLVTEGVRGEGGILVNSEGHRFMFDNIPERFASETADTVGEADRWLAGDKNARRPPELLTRDVVARAIRKEVKAGRGTPHGGAFLDIANQRSAEDIKKKLPSMYHQFKVLAELDITTDPMEVGPTLHYMMGGIRVNADTQMSRVPGLFACGECSGGMHGANRLGGNSLSDLLVFGELAGEGASDYIKGLSQKLQINDGQVKTIIRNATEILNRESGKNPYLLHEELVENMQNSVGIVRTKELLSEGIEKLENLKLSYKDVKANGASQYNPGWHEALALRNLIITAESVARSALMREESRGAHTRVDFPGEQVEWLDFNVVISKAENGNMQTNRVAREKPDEELERIANLSIESLENEILTEE
ncbi:MAG: fumarate reductase/succinate dehydrogenase flavoprotein subunit [Candidatus Marinimicrobia bacterium]|jgi:succinate dehydrogenase / fumarate reductase flavoprotein subunit|nr:fumarate reductase/succinate dehydrogenase flavoprotein subunit [Candidatus Neomarinimicrobiota bacterium]MDP6628572.1 fumarate reductase/succinate dehydrogenase flavoprotein subunit [Candidatus Neomarinimicrobiota bacterium]MEC7730344.1 fumarate reductase/succinate dehydrogenase flavoprotein subunit [Candidatus Neomarinimicrobiota bacterium]MEC9456727.1 fumarate reductase/succinate dehydrogenase flavoprotein subunit [Candidatus Neomarinimicrobiota bacterium]MED5218790.1 fumarate reductase/s|tara:strand:- start:923 stop:2764 length:1842 start_codon:yes stop_codon:yes gene_type:complete